MFLEYKYCHVPGNECHDHQQITQGKYKPKYDKDLINHKPAAKFSRLTKKKISKLKKIK